MDNKDEVVALYICLTGSEITKERNTNKHKKKNKLLLQVKQESAWVFDAVLDLSEEGHCLLAIDQPVIIGQSQIHNRSHFNLPIDYRCPVSDG